MSELETQRVVSMTSSARWFGCHEFYFPIYWVANHPNWLSFFQRGGPTTNQSWKWNILLSQPCWVISWFPAANAMIALHQYSAWMQKLMSNQLCLGVISVWPWNDVIICWHVCVYVFMRFFVAFICIIFICSNIIYIYIHTYLHPGLCLFVFIYIYIYMYISTPKETFWGIHGI